MTTTQTGDPTEVVAFTILFLAMVAAVVTAAVLWLLVWLAEARRRRHPVSPAEAETQALRTSKLPR